MRTHAHMCVCLYVCAREWKYANMKNRIRRMILSVVELFANVQCFCFYIKPSSRR